MKLQKYLLWSLRKIVWFPFLIYCFAFYFVFYYIIIVLSLIHCYLDKKEMYLLDDMLIFQTCMHASCSFSLRVSRKQKNYIASRLARKITKG